MEVSGQLHALEALSQEKIAVFVDNRPNIYAFYKNSKSKFTLFRDSFYDIVSTPRFIALDVSFVRWIMN
jgi:hypothetical protein